MQSPHAPELWRSLVVRTCFVVAHDSGNITKKHTQLNSSDSLHVACFVMFFSSGGWGRVGRGDDAKYVSLLTMSRVKNI